MNKIGNTTMTVTVIRTEVGVCFVAKAITFAEEPTLFLIKAARELA